MEHLPIVARAMNAAAEAHTLRNPAVYVSKRAFTPAPIISPVTPGTLATPVVFCPSKSVTNCPIESVGRPASAAAFPTFSPRCRVAEMKTALSDIIKEVSCWIGKELQC